MRPVLKVIDYPPSSYYASLKKKVMERKGICGRPVSGYSLDKNGEKITDGVITEILKEIIEGEGFYYGYHKLTQILRKHYGIIINKKKVYRLCKEANLLRPQRNLKKRHPRKLARNRVVTAPNQLWEADIKYGYIAGENRFFYIGSFIDVFDRYIVSYHIGLSCTSRDMSITLKEGLVARGAARPVIRTDSGSQFIGSHFEDICLALGLEHERIPYRTPDKNAHIEAFHSILQQECLENIFENYAEAYSVVTAFMKFYNERRIHGKLGYMSPEEYGKSYRYMKTKEIRV